MKPSSLKSMSVKAWHPVVCSFVKLGLSSWDMGGFLREETLLNVPHYIFRNSNFASAFRFLLIDF